MPAPQPRVIAEIERLFPEDYLALNETQYLISTTGTAQGLTNKLGMGPPPDTSTQITGSAVVLAASTYWGRAPTVVWDWMKAKLESAPSG